jgi:methionyl-tRNA formyltransferase
MATLAPILTREDGRMDFSRTASDLVNRWRGFQPWPGAFTSLRGKKLIVHRMTKSSGNTSPGEILVVGDKFLVGCKDSVLELQEVQLEGKKRMAAAEFLRGFQIKTGERMGE